MVVTALEHCVKLPPRFLESDRIVLLSVVKGPVLSYLVSHSSVVVDVSDVVLVELQRNELLPGHEFCWFSIFAVEDDVAESGALGGCVFDSFEVTINAQLPEGCFVLAALVDVDDVHDVLLSRVL